MAHFDEYAADRRAALSRARLPAQWRPWMKQWSMFRGAAWKIDRGWTAHHLIAQAEILKGHAWSPLSKAPPKIALIDECVADLAGCVVARDVEDRDHRARDRSGQWSQQFVDFDIEPWDDDYLDILDEDQRWEQRLNAARERGGDLLLVHYLLPHVRMYRKLRALKLSERAYYYRLNSALDALEREYDYRAEPPENVQF
jgi:hypothetical protein